MTRGRRREPVRVRLLTAAFRRTVLPLYPKELRRAFGDEIAGELRRSLLEAAHQRRSTLRTWLALVADVRSARRLAHLPPAPGGRLPGGRWTMDSLRQDVRHALRTFLKDPNWTAATVCTLALAIGATTAMFGVVNAVLIRPLAYPDPDGLVALRFSPHDERLRGTWETLDERARFRRPRMVTYPAYQAWRRATPEVFDELGAYGGPRGFEVGLGEGTFRLPGALVSANLFRLLGVRPELGRDFVGEEDVAGSAGVVVVSHELWQQRLGGRTGIVGQTIDIGRRPYTIVGVMPAGFDFPAPETRIWMPLGRGNQSPTAWNYQMIGRVREGLSPEQAKARLDGLTVTARGREGADVEYRATFIPLHAAMVGDARPLLLICTAAVIAVLLLACVNVINLMLTRATARQSEHVIRAALGAGSGRLARQLLTESLVVSAVGGGLGVALAALLTRAVVTLSPGAIPRQEQIGIDGSVLAFAAGLVAVVGIGVGIIPALRASRADLLRGLNAGARGASAGSGQGRIRDGLVVAQLSLALVLLVCAGLLLRSFAGLLSVETGFDGRNVLTFETALPATRYPEFRQRRLFYEEMLARIRTLPGTRSAGLVTYLPTSGYFHTASPRIEGYTQAPEEEIVTEAKEVTPGYFDALGIELRAGRLFDARDDAAAPPVVVVNQALAQRLWPDGEAVGRRLRFNDEEPWRTVIGVVNDVRYRRGERYRGDQESYQIYRPYAASTNAWGRMGVLVRTEVDPTELAAQVRDVVATIDPEVGVFGLISLEERLWDFVAEPRFRTALLGGFGLVALILAVIGVYGVMAYAVAQRTQEMGIRMALGASRTHVIRAVVARGLVLTVLGLGIGTVIAYRATEILEGYLVRLGTHDPASFGTGILVLAAASLAACAVPALRAARIDPLIVMKAE